MLLRFQLRLVDIQLLVMPPQPKTLLWPVPASLPCNQVRFFVLVVSLVILLVEVTRRGTEHFPLMAAILTLSTLKPVVLIDTTFSRLVPIPTSGCGILLQLLPLLTLVALSIHRTTLQ